MALQSKELIGKLVAAEEEAEKIIKAARDLKSTRMKDVRTVAEEELKPFKAQMEADFAAKSAELTKKGNMTAELDRITSAELGTVQKDFESQKANGARYVLENVLSIDLSVPENIKQSLV